MFGKPGKYMSMEKGPIAESNPRISISKNFFFLFLLIGIEQNYDSILKWGKSFKSQAAVHFREQERSICFTK